MDYERYHEENHLKIEIADRIAIVTLDRPDKRNAIDYKLHEGLERALPHLGFDPDVGAIVLTGAGSAFCAGGDLTGFYPPGASGPSAVLRNRELNWAMARCEAPLIAAVNGTAAGLGATIALMCDVIMADTAVIGDTHPAVGSTAGDGGQAYSTFESLRVPEATFSTALAHPMVFARLRLAARNLRRGAC